MCSEIKCAVQLYCKGTHKVISIAELNKQKEATFTAYVSFSLSCLLSAEKLTTQLHSLECVSRIIVVVVIVKHR
jgi:hypothetical protein